MGRGLQARRGGVEGRIVVRLAGSYLAVFLAVIGALSVLAYALIAANYRGTLGPALDTPEGGAALAASLRSVAASIVSIDAALALLVGAASLALARSAVRPLIDAREREARFAADVAHELRTPLGVIASVAQAARDASPDARSDALATIGRQALEASALIADLLTLARSPESRALAREPVDLAAIATREVREHERAAEERGITLSLTVRSAIVDGDERRLRQVLRNLLDNALRYATRGIDVSVGVDGRDAEIVVVDDGGGVQAALRPLIFERFAKAPDSEGSGLGLAICHWVARSHGGTISLDGGSRFVVRLPLGNYPDAVRVGEERET
jgi:signal transduction histidine kinase